VFAALWMIKRVLGWIMGDLTRALSDAYAAKHNADTEQARIEAEKHIARLEVQQANRALGGRITAFVQMAWAAPFILYTWKLVVWDKMLGLGATDPLSIELLTMQRQIAALYFGGAAAIGVVRAIKR